MASKVKSKTYIVLHYGIVEGRGKANVVSGRYRVGAKNPKEAEELIRELIGKHKRVRVYYEEKQKLLQHKEIIKEG